MMRDPETHAAEKGSGVYDDMCPECGDRDYTPGEACEECNYEPYGIGEDPDAAYDRWKDES